MLLHHIELGGDGRPPMVVLHGLLGSSRNWLSTGRDLAKHFHVFALDARNHGKSAHAPDMTYATLAQDVIDWMDAQGLARVTLVGHSMGGILTLRLYRAAKNGRRFRIPARRCYRALTAASTCSA